MEAVSSRCFALAIASWVRLRSVISIKLARSQPVFAGRQSDHPDFTAEVFFPLGYEWLVRIPVLPH